MDVDDIFPVPGEKIGGKGKHVAGQHEEIGVARHRQDLFLFAQVARGVHKMKRDLELFHQPAVGFVVTDDERDIATQFPRPPEIQQLEKAVAGPGDHDPHALAGP